MRRVFPILALLCVVSCNKQTDIPARRTFATINVLRGVNIHAIKRCTGHQDLRVLEHYVRDE